MEARFVNCSNNPSVFTSLLPPDWQESLALIEEKQLTKSTIYSLIIHGEICAGGIVFPEFLPEMADYKDDANYWFLKGYLYIGFVWVPLDKRNNKYGSLWLAKLLEQDPNQPYWLTIEDLKLRNFYEQAGFTFVKSLALPNGVEELFVLEKKSG